MDAQLNFSDIYRQHAGAVFRLAWVLTGNRSDAEDLCSEAFARALAGGGEIVQSTVRSYLYAIVRNLAASRYRRPTVELAAQDELVDATPSPDPGPEQQAELRQQITQASSALSTLNEGERHALLLCAQYGLSTSEIARALGLAPGHVRVRLHRARRHLQAILDQQERRHASP